MTVDGLDMRVQPRATRVGNQDAHEERWKELADLKEGRRENWMTDRAKNALGTAKLASVYLEEEKRRIRRLRKTKSVLASEKLMGRREGTSSTQPNTRRRRRPYPEPSHRVGNGYQGRHTTISDTHRRHNQTDDSLPFLKPNYPTEPFGNITHTLARKLSLGDALGEARHEVDRRPHDKNTGRSAALDYTGNRGGNQETSSISGRQQEPTRSGLLGKVASRGNGTAPRVASGLLFAHKEHGDFSGHKLSTPISASRTAEVEGSQAISSGPSAIDLFDQCDLVPMAAIKVEGLVGTTYRANENINMLDTTADKNTAVNTHNGYPTAPALASPKPPLVSGGAPIGIRGVARHQKDTGRHEVRVRKAANSTSTVTVSQPRLPVTGGHITAASRSSQQEQQVSSRGEPLPSKGNGKARRGASDSSEPTKGSKQGRSDASQSERIAPAQADRVRRRWNVDGAGTAAVVPPVQRVEPEGETFSSEQRLANAKERLHKSKNLDALKSEHVEALSILQDISCPSTAAVRSAVEDKSKSAEDVAVQAATSVLHKRTDAVAASPNLALPGVELDLADAEVDKISADLPRIGSQEQAALRSLYRKWWMTVANGGNLPSPFTPDLLEVFQMCRGEVIDTGKCYGDGGAALTAQGTIQRGADVGSWVEEKAVGTGVGTRDSVKGEESGFDPDTRSEPAGCKGGTAGAATNIGQQMALGTVTALSDGNGTRSTEVKGGRVEVTKKGGRDTEAAVEDELPESPRTKYLGSTTSSPLRASDTQPAAESDGAPEDFGRTPRSADREAREYGKEANFGPPLPTSQVDSDVDSVAEDDHLEREEEEGHHGRIYLPDGRFVSTRRDSSNEKDDSTLSDDDVADGDEGAAGKDVVRDGAEAASEAGEGSTDYADEVFES